MEAKVIYGSDLKVGHRVLRLHEDGTRRSAVVEAVGRKGRLIDVLFDNGRGATYGADSPVQIEVDE